MMSLVYETETGRECLGWKLKVSRARDKEGELREKGLTTRAGRPGTSQGKDGDGGQEELPE
jgi:hypothetical protein